MKSFKGRGQRRSRRNSRTCRHEACRIREGRLSFLGAEFEQMERSGNYNVIRYSTAGMDGILKKLMGSIRPGALKS